MNDVHIGSVIKEKVKERHLSVRSFSKMIHYSESNTYSLFTRKSLDSELLEIVSEVLDYDLKTVYNIKNSTEQDYIAVIRINKVRLNELLENDKTINLIGSQELSK